MTEQNMLWQSQFQILHLSHCTVNPMLSMATFFSAHKCQLLRDSGKNVLIPAAQPGQECQSDIILNTSFLYKWKLPLWEAFLQLKIHQNAFADHGDRFLRLWWPETETPLTFPTPPRLRRLKFPASLAPRLLLLQHAALILILVEATS